MVTAQRRSERLQEVPITITAVTNSTLADAGVTSSLQLNRLVPSLNFTKQQGFNTPFLRGVGTANITAGDEPNVATYIDGIYQGAQTTAGLPYNNVERIEVLKGPQGTLYGRNATGGLISIITREPSRSLAAEAGAGYGNYGIFEGDAYLSGPISSGIAADLSIHGRTQDRGFDHNLTNDERTGKNKFIALRSKVAISLGGATLDLAGDYTNTHDNTSLGVVAFPGSVPLVGVPFLTPNAAGTGVDVNPATTFSSTPRRYYAALNPFFMVKSYGFSATLRADVGFANFVSLTGYRHVDQEIRTASALTAADGYLAIVSPDPLVGVVVPGTLSYDSKQQSPYFVTQELQLVSKAGGAFNWIVGGFGQWSKERYHPIAISFKVAQPFVDIRSAQKTEAEAIYAQGTYAFDNGLSVTLGARYGTEKKSLTGTQAVFGTVAASTDKSKRFNSFTFRGAVEYEVADNARLFASFNRGFKSGLFSANAIDNSPAVRPERLDAIEAGIKSNPSRSLQINASGYYYNYTNLQQFINNAGGLSSLQNAPKARMYGGEIDVQALPVDNLSVRLGIGVEHSEYVDFPNALAYLQSPFGGEQSVSLNVKGRQVARTPNFTGTLGINYDIPLSFGKIALGGNLYRSSSFAWSPSNEYRQGAYTTLDLSVAIAAHEDRWRATVFAHNLTNKTYATSVVENTRSVFVGYAEPRTYGIKLQFKYR